MEKREKWASFYIVIISVLGWLLMLVGAFFLSIPENPSLFLVLIIFIALTEAYPIPIWKGNSSLSLPILYTFTLFYEFPIVMVSYGLILFFINLLQNRPVRVVFFNPALLNISLFFAYIGAPYVISYVDQVFSNNAINLVTHLAAFTLLYYLTNNVIVDILLSIRPQAYTLKRWLHKSGTELTIAAIAFLYGYLMIRLGRQDRGPVDVFSIFFFFSPLVGISLLSSINLRLQKQRNRLADLYSITIDLNKRLASEDWMEVIRTRIKQVMEVDAFILWVKDREGRWKLSFQDGQIEGAILSEKVISFIESTKTTIVYPNRKRFVFSSHIFSPALKALVFVPLSVEDETYGMLAAARTRTHSFTNGDIRSITSLASQFAIILKTQRLIEENEKSKILEERNRIARDIHDGIAQSLAGATMNLEIATRKFYEKPEDSRRLVEDSVHKLRDSLKELRNSIYALRPYPTERVGLKQAIEGKIASWNNQKDLSISFETRGNPVQLHPMVERTMFEIFQEAATNAFKHSKANMVDVLLSYQKQHVLLKIHDNGVGFSLLDAMIKAKEGHHFGILNMNEQAEKLGATLQIDSKEGKGTAIEFTVPKSQGGMNDDQRRIGG